MKKWQFWKGKQSEGIKNEIQLPNDYLPLSYPDDIIKRGLLSPSTGWRVAKPQSKLDIRQKFILDLDGLFNVTPLAGANAGNFGMVSYVDRKAEETVKGQFLGSPQEKLFDKIGRGSVIMKTMKMTGTEGAKKEMEGRIKNFKHEGTIGAKYLPLESSDFVAGIGLDVKYQGKEQHVILMPKIQYNENGDTMNGQEFIGEVKSTYTDPSDICFIALQLQSKIGENLAELHDKTCIAHLDLKWDNFFLSSKETEETTGLPLISTRIGDFGCALPRGVKLRGSDVTNFNSKLMNPAMVDDVDSVVAAEWDLFEYKQLLFSFLGDVFNIPSGLIFYIQQPYEDKWTYYTQRSVLAAFYKDFPNACILTTIFNHLNTALKANNPQIYKQIEPFLMALQNYYNGQAIDSKKSELLQQDSAISSEQLDAKIVEKDRELRLNMQLQGFLVLIEMKMANLDVVNDENVSKFKAFLRTALDNIELPQQFVREKDGAYSYLNSCANGEIQILDAYKYIKEEIIPRYKTHSEQILTSDDVVEVDSQVLGGVASLKPKPDGYSVLEELGGSSGGPSL